MTTKRTRRKTPRKIIEEQLGVAGIGMLKRSGLCAIPIAQLREFVEVFSDEPSDEASDPEVVAKAQTPLSEDPVTKGIYQTAISTALVGEQLVDGETEDSFEITRSMAAVIAEKAVEALVKLSDSEE